MRFRFRRALAVDVRVGDPVYEIQITDGDRRMIWYSGPPYMTRSEAVAQAKDHVLVKGHALKVKNVENGEVAFSR